MAGAGSKANLSPPQGGEFQPLLTRPDPVARGAVSVAAERGAPPQHPAFDSIPDAKHRALGVP